MTIEQEIEDFLEKIWEELESIPNVLSVSVGHKYKDGVDTGQPCITFMVSKKLPVSTLNAVDVIPYLVGGFVTDIVELAPEGWVAGKTFFNTLSPKERKRRLGAIITPKPKMLTVERINSSFISDLSSKCGVILDQGDCGSCTAFGSKKTIQDTDKILTGADYELSAEMLFECSGGTCNAGNTVEATLDYAKNTGVALEADCPYVSYNGIDEPCGYQLVSDWYLGGKMLSSWASITNLVAMKQYLSNLPLVTTMNVPQSFMNYVGGIYTPQPNDPIVGGHCIECVGVDDIQGFWKCANSWAATWGESGYFRIKQGVCGIDDEMFSVVISPNPPPPFNPSPPSIWTEILDFIEAIIHAIFGQTKVIA